ncbi:MBL fold metallo-hydrolase [Streptomyces carpaticus]|uniref:MBL fold metallo-hydrolase n=1 Tax=Streptomyces carpaticus TaxID=285558 RepID=UPI002201BFC7|nr:MBL fold metallo-hydrolase [Streptomyces carpaticus]
MTEDSGWVESMTLGEVEVIRIVEWHRPFAPATGLVPGAGAGVWRENAHWLAPDHWDPVSGRAVLALQTWVLRGAGLTVVVDTGAGNGRERPGMPPFHRCTGDFPALLARAGVRPRDVDVVVNTHLHVDHVGWNTVERDGEWVPMFPRARYLLPAADDAHFGPAGGYGQGRDPADRLVYEDSVAPLHRAGVVELWEGSHRIDARLTLESVPGHTPGSSVLRLVSGSARAVFVGDLVHSPVQILRPDANSGACLDPVRAVAGRRRVLERAAGTGELLIPAHFGGPGAVEVRRAPGGGFALGPWAGGWAAVRAPGADAGAGAG